MHHLRLALSTSISYQFGMVGTCVFGFVFLTAVSPIRHAYYEIFLNLHRVLIPIGLLGVYVHIDKSNLPQRPYIMTAITFWVLEWAWRVAGICYYNVSRKLGISKVTVEALPAEACRLTFALRDLGNTRLAATCTNTCLLWRFGRAIFSPLHGPRKDIEVHRWKEKRRSGRPATRTMHHIRPNNQALSHRARRLPRP